jgi:hypothetical protein
MPVSAVVPGARLMPARVRALLDFLDQSRDRLPPAPSIPARGRRSRMRVSGAR